MRDADLALLEKGEADEMSDDDLRDFFDVVEGLRYKYEALLRQQMTGSSAR